MENAGQNIYDQFEANNDSTAPFGEPFSFAGQHDLQTQQNAMRAQNMSSRAAAQAAGFASQSASQPLPYPLVPNQSIQYQLTQDLQAGIRSGGNKLLHNQRKHYPSGQLETLQPPSMPHTNQSNKKAADSPVDPAEWKRMKGRAYREKCKEKEQEKKNHLDALRLDNENLKRQNESLTKENLEMNKALQFHEEEIKQLKNGFGQLNRKYDLQHVIVEALSEQVAHPNNINIQIDNKHLEVLQQENKKLRNKRRRLKVKERALCEKIINEFDEHQETTKSIKDDDFVGNES